MPNVTAMVLVGGRGSRLKDITIKTAKPAVSFGGKYRLIDFVLSNLSNSDITNVGLVTQYEPHGLMKYIGHGSTWDLDVNSGGISFLTPYTTIDGNVWQKGTANAIFQHFRFIEQKGSDIVLILSGDHIYKMDYNKLIQHHINKESDITVATFKVDKEHHRFGIVNVDANDQIIDFEEKPENPKSNLGSMGVYVFNKNVLEELLTTYDTNLDFGGDVIPVAISLKKRLFAYKFKGYFKDVGTIESLYETNMDLIDNPGFLKLHEYRNLPIYTKSSNLPPHHIVVDSGVHNALISDGCLIYGTVEHSILSAGVFLKRNSEVYDSILHENVIVGTHSIVRNAIVIEDTIIPDNMKLEFRDITVVTPEFILKWGESNE